MKRLLGKSALITGAGRGLGRAIALAFAAEGARLVLSYKDSAAAALKVVHEAHGLGVEALAIRADLAEAEEIDHLVSQSVDAFGGINVLVNNAGLFSTRTLLETSDELWERLLAVNLTAPFRCARALAP